MAAVEMRADLSNLVDALVSGSKDRIIAAVREHLQQNQAPDVLIGRIGTIAALGDSDGHIVTTLGAAAMLSRYLHFIPLPLEPDALDNREKDDWSRALPIFAQAMQIAAPAVRAGNNVTPQYPESFFPSELVDTGKTVGDVLREAVLNGDTTRAESIILGLYGTGADYRTMQVRTYDATSAIFQDDGHPLILAVRGFNVLDAVEWGDLAPNIIHWIAPHLPLKKDAKEPAWAETVRKFVTEHHEGLASLRVRLGAPKEENALALRKTVLEGTDPAQICQAVYDTLLKGEASPVGVGSVLSLAAAEMLLQIPDSDRDTFIRVSHGLLYAAAARTAIHQSRQDTDVLPVLFFAAAYINTIQKELVSQKKSEQTTSTPTGTITRGGGLIGVTQLETLRTQLKNKDYTDALTTTQRYLQLGNDPRALFGSIAQIAALTDATADQGHTLQIVQAASEEFLAWPRSLKETNIEAFLQVALRTSINGKRDPLVENV
jgi:hypothetical protein